MRGRWNIAPLQRQAQEVSHRAHGGHRAERLSLRVLRGSPTLSVALVPAAILVALVLRLALWMQPLHQLANDEIEYVTVARDLLAGRGWVFYEQYHWLRAPLYPLFLAASLWLSGGDLWLAALPNIVLSVATVPLAALLASELFSAAKKQGQVTVDHAPLTSRPAILAAWLTALFWTLATFGSLYMSETLFTFLFTSALLLLLRWRRTGSLPTLALAGIVLGLATLTRSVPLAFLPLLALWVVLGDRGQGIGDRRQGTGDRETGRQGDRGQGTGRRGDGETGRRGDGETGRRGDGETGTGVWEPQPQSPIPNPQSPIPNPQSPIPNPQSLLLLLACCLLTIAPWTVRNCLAYGRCIVVETGLSYNLWAFNEPREDGAAIFRALEAIPNPAERADYATAQGLERLREDPTILVRKLWPNWSYLWRVNPIIEDRFLLRSYYADPPPVVFLAALLFDDALMALIAVAGVLGLARAANRRAALLGAGWLLYIVVTMLLTHGEGRYRHFLFPVLIPCAAIALKGTIQPQSAQRSQRAGVLDRWPTVAAGLVAVLLLFTIAQTYPWGWAWGGLRRSVWVLAGDLAWRAGDLPSAEAAYRRAIESQSRADAWMGLGDIQRARGNVREALLSYSAANVLSPAYIAPAVRRGDLLRAEGRHDEARIAFDVPYAERQQLVDWAWSDLRPAPAEHIAVGDGLDFGYVGGVYPAEEQQGRRARWTNGRALLRVKPPPSGALFLRLAAPRPAGSPPEVQVCWGGECTTLPLAEGWRTYRILLPPGASPTAPIELRSDTFLAPDGRLLGVLIDEVGW